MRALQDAAATAAGRLLCLLLVRVDEVPASASTPGLPLLTGLEPRVPEHLLCALEQLAKSEPDCEATVEQAYLCIGHGHEPFNV